MKQINTSELKQGFSIFGNKGNVWANKAHIKRDGMHPTTLCGVPMLAFNHAKKENLQTIGCQKCIEIYESEEGQKK